MHRRVRVSTLVFFYYAAGTSAATRASHPACNAYIFAEHPALFLTLASAPCDTSSVHIATTPACQPPPHPPNPTTADGATTAAGELSMKYCRVSALSCRGTLDGGAAAATAAASLPTRRRRHHRERRRRRRPVHHRRVRLRHVVHDGRGAAPRNLLQRGGGCVVEGGKGTVCGACARRRHHHALAPRDAQQLLHLHERVRGAREAAQRVLLRRKLDGDAAGPHAALDHRAGWAPDEDGQGVRRERRRVHVASVARRHQAVHAQPRRRPALLEPGQPLLPRKPAPQPGHDRLRHHRLDLLLLRRDLPGAPQHLAHHLLLLVEAAPSLLPHLVVLLLLVHRALQRARRRRDHRPLPVRRVVRVLVVGSRAGGRGRTPARHACDHLLLHLVLLVAQLRVAELRHGARVAVPVVVALHHRHEQVARLKLHRLRSLDDEALHHRLQVVSEAFEGLCALAAEEQVVVQRQQAEVQAVPERHHRLLLADPRLLLLPVEAGVRVDGRLPQPLVLGLPLRVAHADGVLRPQHDHLHPVADLADDGALGEHVAPLSLHGLVLRLRGVCHEREEQGGPPPPRLHGGERVAEHGDDHVEQHEEAHGLEEGEEERRHDPPLLADLHVVEVADEVAEQGGGDVGDVAEVLDHLAEHHVSHDAEAQEEDCEDEQDADELLGGRLKRLHEDVEAGVEAEVVQDADDAEERVDAVQVVCDLCRGCDRVVVRRVHLLLEDGLLAHAVADLDEAETPHGEEEGVVDQVEEEPEGAAEGDDERGGAGNDAFGPVVVHAGRGGAPDLEAPDQQVGADQEEECEHEPVVRKLVVGPLEQGVVDVVEDCHPRTSGGNLDEVLQL
eukprot:Rhum_TRINITY_DN8412_c0_g1::Rhum_TRINITY_DN8412_c0_g1_i1::g.27805::m.27805